MVPGRRRQPKRALSPGSRLPARASPAWAAPPSLATTQTRTAEGCAGRRSAQGRGRVVESAPSTPAARPLPFPQEPTPGARSEREPASEAGGRVGVCPGLLRRPPSSESHGGAHSSFASLPRPLPIPPATNLTAGVRGSPPDDPTRDGGPTRQSSRRGWARRVPGRRWGGRFGACAAPPALPGSRGCRQRSTSARWRPSRSAPPCPGAGCRRG